MICTMYLQLTCPVGKKYAYHGEIDIGGVELHVDLLVDQSLTILMVVLPDL